MFLTGLIWGKTETIAVFDFKYDSLSSNEIITIMDRFKTDITKVSDFIIVDRERINKILKDRGVETNSCFQDCAIEVGTLLGALKVVCGSIGRISLSYNVSAMVIDTKTGDIVKSIRYNIINNDSISSSEINTIALKINEKESLNKLSKEKMHPNILNNNRTFLYDKPLATSWQVETMKIRAKRRGINIEYFVQECYDIPLAQLTKVQGEEIIRFFEYKNPPLHWLMSK